MQLPNWLTAFSRRSVDAIYSVAWFCIRGVIGRRGRNKVTTYTDEFKPIVVSASISLIVLTALAAYAIPNEDKTLGHILTFVFIPIVSVVFGAFLQQAVVTIVTPSRDVI